MIKHFYFKYKYVRISNKKLNVLSKSLTGLDIIQSKNILNFICNRGQFLILKYLKNCLNSLFKKEVYLDKYRVYISNILIQKGPSMKRFKFFSKGLTRPFEKKSSHLIFILSVIKKN